MVGLCGANLPSGSGQVARGRGVPGDRVGQQNDGRGQPPPLVTMSGTSNRRALPDKGAGGAPIESGDSAPNDFIDLAPALCGAFGETVPPTDRPADRPARRRVGHA